MSKEINVQEKDREVKYLNRIQELEETNHNLTRQNEIVNRKHHKEVVQLNRKIKQTTELVKAVMSLSKDDFAHFEQNSSTKHKSSKNFSFDLTKVVKNIDNDSANGDQSSEEKEKIIIKEPLEVFEIDNMGKM